jgi:hypothetical protein
MDSNQHTVFNIVLNFIPIILLFFILAYPLQVQEFSLTFLGKALFVSLIPILSALSLFVGIFYCILLIVFYQNRGTVGSTATL